MSQDRETPFVAFPSTFIMTVFSTGSAFKYLCNFRILLLKSIRLRLQNFRIQVFNVNSKNVLRPINKKILIKKTLQLKIVGSNSIYWAFHFLFEHGYSLSNSFNWTVSFHCTVNFLDSSLQRTKWFLLFILM